MATLQNIGKLKYRGKDGQWHPLPVVVQDAGGGVSTISGKGAPTSETQGEVNQLYRDEDTQKLYICTATDGGYTWAAVVSDTEDAVTYTAQTLTNAQKTQARANIGAGTSNFSGSYNDLSNKPNIPVATVIDTTLSKSGQAADAKAAGDAIGKKIDKAQGTGNAGKILGIGADGNVTPQDKPVQALAGASAPTTATAGVVGQEYYVIVGNAVTEMYVCTAVANGTYTWGKVDMSEQVQADWNQNDSTQPDYVKNRPFYTGDPVETKIFEEQTANFTVDVPITLPFTDDEATNQLYDSIWDGATIRVVWDGEIYDCVTSNGEAGGDNEPFFLSLAVPEIYATESGEHTFSITYIKYNVYKIEEKYLPDTVIKSEYGAHIMPAINLSSVFDFPYFSSSDATSGSNSMICTIEQWNDISKILKQARTKSMVYAVSRQVERCNIYNDHKLKIWGSRISETGEFKVNVSLLEYVFRNKTLTVTYCAN